MTNYLENKSCLFFGLDNCPYTKKCIDELKKYRLDTTLIFCKKRGENLPESVKKWKGDFIFSYFNYWLLTKEILNNARFLPFNFHPATPKYPGSGSPSWALYEKSDKFGITVHLMNEKFDNGSIIKVYNFNIDKNENLLSLTLKTKNFSVFVFKDFLKILNEEGLKKIEELKSKNKYTWRGEAKKLCDIDKMRKLNINLSQEEIIKRINSFHLEKFPVYFEVDSHQFFYKTNND